MDELFEHCRDTRNLAMGAVALTNAITREVEAIHNHGGLMISGAVSKEHADVMLATAHLGEHLRRWLAQPFGSNEELYEMVSRSTVLLVHAAYRLGLQDGALPDPLRRPWVVSEEEE